MVSSEHRQPLRGRAHRGQGRAARLRRNLRPRGPQVGSEQLGLSVYELEPGLSICPYHYENAEEEWLIVLAGRPTLRTPAGERELGPWDCAFFPTGEEGAHKVTNRTDETVRVCIWSNRIAVCDVGLSGLGEGRRLAPGQAVPPGGRGRLLHRRDVSSDSKDWPEPLTVRKVSAELDCSEDEARALIRDGELKTVACGIRPGLVPRHELDDYLRRNKQTGPSEPASSRRRRTRGESSSAVTARASRACSCASASRPNAA